MPAKILVADDSPNIREILKLSLETDGYTVVLAEDEGGAIAGAEQRFTIKAGETTTVEIRRPILTRVFGTVTGVDGPVAHCNVELKKDEPDMPQMLGIGGGVMLVPLMVFAFSAQDFPVDRIVHLALGTSLTSVIAAKSLCGLIGRS